MARFHSISSLSSKRRRLATRVRPSVRLMERNWSLACSSSSVRSRTREANLMLETRVRERTEELEQANDQLRSMSLTDGLTRVANRRRFYGKPEIEWHRALRHDHE